MTEIFRSSLFIYIPYIYQINTLFKITQSSNLSTMFPFELCNHEREFWRVSTSLIRKSIMDNPSVQNYASKYANPHVQRQMILTGLLSENNPLCFPQTHNKLTIWCESNCVGLFGVPPASLRQDLNLQRDCSKAHGLEPTFTHQL